MTAAWLQRMFRPGAQVLGESAAQSGIGNRIPAGAGGVERGSDTYGADYLSEIARIFATHAPRRDLTVVEWGMGNSTKFMLEERESLRVSRLISIDDHRKYFDRLVAHLPKWSGFSAHCLDLVGPRNSDRDPESNYATFPIELNIPIDVFYIDGRRRMECALAAAHLAHAETIVLLHDYRRFRYQTLEVVFETLEAGSQFRVLRLRRELLGRNAVPAGATAH